MSDSAFKVEIPKILFLALSVASFYKKTYYNTNDLASLANTYESDLVRQRVDKKDYRYLNDTNFGGLRGNFSTLLTWKGFVKRGSLVVNSQSLGKDGRLVNAICKGEIILDPKDQTAHTRNSKLKDLLEREAWLFKTRENQAHIKSMLSKNPELGLSRDNVSFPKESVVKTEGGQYFIRALLNNYVDENTIEFCLTNLWEGKKLKKRNLHLLLAIPKGNDAWSEIYALRIEDLLVHEPLLLRLDIKNKKCCDRDGNVYPLYSLDKAKQMFSKGTSNIKERLAYDWKILKEREIVAETVAKPTKETEFGVFLNDFLEWKKGFEIDGKIVVDMRESSSGGPDVLLTYSGGTSQKLELEHEWRNYLTHRHHEDNAWSGVWLFARQEWNPVLITKLFSALSKTHRERIPTVFLCLENGIRKAYRADWAAETFSELPLQF